MVPLILLYMHNDIVLTLALSLSVISMRSAPGLCNDRQGVQWLLMEQREGEGEASDKQSY